MQNGTSNVPESATRCDETTGMCEAEVVCPSSDPASGGCHGETGTCGYEQACDGSNYAMSCTVASSVLSCTCQRDGQTYYEFSIFGGLCSLEVFAMECGPNPSPT